MEDKRLNEVTKVTDMAYVPVIMADGSIGQIAKADLATVVAGVLGNPIASKNNLTSTDNIDDININGIYSFYAERGLPINLPSGFDRGCIIVFNNNVHSAQLIVGLSAVKIRIGGNSVWYSWINIV